MSNTLTACFRGGKFVVNYDLDTSLELALYDRLEVKEIFTHEGMEDSEDNHITTAVQITSSTLHTDEIAVTPLAPLGLGTGKYYVRYILSSEDKEIARSEVFGADQAASDDDDILSKDSDACKIEVIKMLKVKDNEIGNAEIELSWKFEGEQRQALSDHLSHSDFLLIMPTDKADEIKSEYTLHAYAMASGNTEGSVKVRIAGLCSADDEYQVFYYDSNKSVCRGKSLPFFIEKELLPNIDYKDEESLQNLKNESSQFNTMAVMQYTVHEHMSKMKASTEYNPLITATIEQNKWEKMIEDDRKKYEMVEKEIEEELGKAKKQESGLADEKSDEVISDVETEEILSEALKEKQAFLYCGAGISISAPSSSPSWWSLMSDVLEETFNAVPEEHQKIAKKLRTSDNHRNPEEIMETYYFVLQKKLLSLFQLLNEGEPNANHRIIAKMVKHGQLRSILTTNFDEFIERALDAEGIKYRVICTSEEFQEYKNSGYSEFTILKIHGTVSRPETIVAVANHYKSGKGFGGVKSTVTAHMVRNYPTVFFGYSGYDFIHANYQSFWESVKDSEEKVYFIKYKGSQGGPSIQKLVGRHIGARLVIGEAILPHMACKVMENFDVGDSKEVMDFHNSIDSAVGQEIAKKQRDYVKSWVANISKVSILAILWTESSYLNESTNLREKKMKKMKGESGGAGTDVSGVTAYLLQLSTQVGQGIITEEEYLQKQRRATMEITFSYASIPMKQKEQLIDILLAETEINPLLKGPNSDDILAMFPSYLMMAGDTADVDASAREIFDDVLKYVRDTLNPLYDKKENGDKKAEVLYKFYYSQSGFLRIRNEEDRIEAEEIIDKYADDAVARELTEEEVTDLGTKEVGPTITRIAYQQIDIRSLIRSQVDDIVTTTSSGEATVDDILESVFIIAVTLQRQATFRSSDAYQSPVMNQIIGMISVNEDKEIPSEMLKRLEDELSSDFQQVIDIVEKLESNGEQGNYLSPREVLSTFVLANVEVIKACLKHIGDSAQKQRVRESCGYYPKDPIPPAVASYLSIRMEEAAHYIEDDRAEQPALAMLVSLGEIQDNIPQMQKAVDTSLAITEGKVTELTPPPIPEALAAAYQAQGNFEKAMVYYKLALDGIQTFVIRQKTDSIVLNACLVINEQLGAMEALRTAFDYSPYFTDNQLNILISPSRGLLVQQCEAWSKELGFNSPYEAKETFLRSDLEQKGSSMKLIHKEDKRDNEKKMKPAAVAGNNSCGSCIVS